MEASKSSPYTPTPHPIDPSSNHGRQYFSHPYSTPHSTDPSLNYGRHYSHPYSTPHSTDPLVDTVGGIAQQQIGNRSPSQPRNDNPWEVDPPHQSTVYAPKLIDPSLNHGRQHPSHPYSTPYPPADPLLNHGRQYFSHSYAPQIEPLVDTIGGIAQQQIGNRCPSQPRNDNPWGSYPPQAADYPQMQPCSPSSWEMPNRQTVCCPTTQTPHHQVYGESPTSLQLSDQASEFFMDRQPLLLAKALHLIEEVSKMSYHRASELKDKLVEKYGEDYLIEILSDKMALTLLAASNRIMFLRVCMHLVDKSNNKNLHKNLQKCCFNLLLENFKDLVNMKLEINEKLLQNFISINWLAYGLHPTLLESRLMRLSSKDTEFKEALKSLKQTCRDLKYMLKAMGKGPGDNQ